MSDAWEVKDNHQAQLQGDPPEFTIERRGNVRGGGYEVAATCWDYGLACLIEAALNMRDGTVE